MAKRQPVSPVQIIGDRILSSSSTADANNLAATPAPKKDLRWQRTERHIFEAFRRQLDDHPVNKISVTQLAADAEINKATFYLHYADVYELAIAYARSRADEVVDSISHLDTFFSDPDTFAREFVEALGGKDHLREGQLFATNGLSSVFADQLAARLYASLQQHQRSESPEQSLVFVTFVVHGVMGLLPMYLENDPDQVAEVTAMAIKSVKEHANGGTA